MPNYQLPKAPPSVSGGNAGPSHDKYEVTAPDGTVYEVEAPAGATEKDVLLQVKKAHEDVATQAPRMSPEDEQAYLQLTSDPKSTAGDIIGFLQQRGFGADQRVVEDFVRQRNKPGARVYSRMSYELPKAPPRIANTARDNVRAGAAAFLDGVLPGSAKAARGAREVVLNAARAPFTDEDFDPAAAYDKGENDIERVLNDFDQKHEDASTGLSIGGMVTGAAVLPQARLFRGGSLAAGTGNAMVNGAGYGFVSGALNDSGEGRLDNAINGTLFGTALGAAVPAATRGASEVASAARRNIPGVDTAARFVGDLPRRVRGQGPSNPDAAAHGQAERILGDMLPNGRISTGMGTGATPATPDNIAAEVASRASRGVPAMPADVSEQGRRVTAWALQGNGPMAQRARSVLSARQAQAGQRIRGHLSDELGPPVDPIQEAEAITRRAQDAAGPAYADAYAAGSPMVVTPELQSIMRRPAFRESLPQAYKNIENRGGDPDALGLRLVPNDRRSSLPPNVPHMVTPEGVYMLDELPTFEAFDQVVRTLNKSIPRSEMTGRPVLDNESGGINDVMRTLDDYLKRTNDPYRAAKANFADEMAVKDAMERGLSVAKVSGPEIEAQLRSMPEHAQEAWMTGARTSLADLATQTSQKYPSTNVPQRLRQAVGLSGAGDPALGDVAKLQAIETMSGRPGVINRLDERLEGEDQAFKTFNEAFGNSKTQPKEAMDEAMSSEALKVAGHLLHGNWSGLASAILFKGNPAGTLRFKQAVQDRIAEIMTEINPQNARQAMDAIVQRARADDQFRQMLDRAGVNPTRLIVLQAAAQDAHAEPLPHIDEDPEDFWPVARADEYDE